ncbi:MULTISPECIES: GlxA family transcriptional regulator [Streptomyces]|uniref:GlxA family transcriptional regulator n=1 Tax=Streptomyces TaxID=1883 RepID=UPI00163D27A3|nr:MULTISPECIES: DJ-1/PfpI family protein [Streptomyces]MBC2875050.1 DJ-1/PfpI family protein [Streptomyces sp. TYQ1024]UBI37483.1 DJ-1/PfpI family protein [Streptomyces mobaraensis]UKW30073.1 DJ-1/PfpI family protein [Streptomyces sp. TYQ1024]
MTRVVFLLVPRLHLLDLAGPAQVFSTADDLGHPYGIMYVSEREDVPTAQGITLRAGTEWPALTPDDLVVVPGWRTKGLREHVDIPRALLDRLVEHHDAGGTVASICAGADALGRAGLLDGRRCTTHHDVQDALARRYPKAQVVRDVLYVTDGRLITSAGIASGIDLALHLVALRHGAATAARVAREMVVFARRNGDDQQHSAMLRHRAHLSDAVHHAQDLIDSRYTSVLRLSDLASSVGLSERSLTRHFTHATGLTPLRYQQELRVEHAEHLIAQGSTVESAARAVGFQDARMLRRLRGRAQTCPAPAGDREPAGLR